MTTRFAGPCPSCGCGSVTCCAGCGATYLRPLKAIGSYSETPIGQEKQLPGTFCGSCETVIPDGPTCSFNIGYDRHFGSTYDPTTGITTTYTACGATPQPSTIPVYPTPFWPTSATSPDGSVSYTLIPGSSFVDQYGTPSPVNTPGVVGFYIPGISMPYVSNPSTCTIGTLTGKYFVVVYPCDPHCSATCNDGNNPNDQLTKFGFGAGPAVCPFVGVAFYPDTPGTYSIPQFGNLSTQLAAANFLYSCDGNAFFFSVGITNNYRTGCSPPTYSPLSTTGNLTLVSA